jgi:multicomponent Na+:H+ antiporter subunit F
VIAAGMVLVALGAGCFALRAVLGPSLADRVVAVDGFVVSIVGLIVLDAARTERAWFLGVALVVAFVGFVGTLAGARFIERRGG